MSIRSLRVGPPSAGAVFVMGCGSFPVEGGSALPCLLSTLEEAMLPFLFCSTSIRNQHSSQPHGSIPWSSSSQRDPRYAITSITVKVHHHSPCQTTENQNSQGEMPRRPPSITIPTLQASHGHQKPTAPNPGQTPGRLTWRVPRASKRRILLETSTRERHSLSPRPLTQTTSEGIRLTSSNRATRIYSRLMRTNTWTYSCVTQK